MEIYDVGGQVRDKLLGKPFSDRDYCVVGSSEEEMVALGFKRVGTKFPVYLHPVTGEEYALARVDKSTGPGYNDFDVVTKDVTIEEDLSRRDLTINSMATDRDNNLLDPCNGLADLEAKVLRHTSEAFKEDPIRVLRLARFRATLRNRSGASLWTIAHETKVMCYSMRDALLSLTPERIWKEVEKVLGYALGYSALKTFMETLYELRVLDVIFPEIYEMVHCREGSKHHREPNVFVHTMTMLGVQATTPLLDLAILYHDVAKPYCYKTFGASKGHDSVELVDPLLPKWIPAGIRKTVLFLISNHTKIYKTTEMSANKIASLLAEYGDKDTLDTQLELAYADENGRITDGQVSHVTQYEEISKAWEAINSYSPSDWIKESETRPSGNAIQQHIHNKNISIVKEVFNKEEDVREHYNTTDSFPAKALHLRLSVAK